MAFDFLGVGNMGNYNQRKVANDSTDKYEIDTARVMDGVLPFETGIKDPRFRDGEWVIVEAYHTKTEALAGHAKWVKLMADGPPAELTDCCNADAQSILGKESFPIKTT